MFNIFSDGTRVLVMVGVWAFWCVAVAIAGDRAEPQELQSITLSPLVSRLLNDPLTDADQRRALAVFHGQWDLLEDPTIPEQAAVALQRYDLNHPSLRHAQTPPLPGAQAALERGDVQRVIELLEGDSSAEAVLITAQALEQMGQTAKALEVLEQWAQGFDPREPVEAAQLTAAADAMAMAAELTGEPGHVYQTALSLLGRAHGEVDRLYWPAMVSEARLLMSRDNPSEAQQSLLESLRLNPRCSPAWYLLGLMAAERFDFQTADRCLHRLRQIHPEHLLGDLLETQSLLFQKNPTAAARVLTQALDRYPRQRQLLALLAATKALTFDEAGLNRVIKELEPSSSSAALACFTAGRFLSLARQYPLGEQMLRRAAEYTPNWPRPYIELGSLLMQAGGESDAVPILLQATALDPFNRRAHNLLVLAQELQGYERIHTEHFVIQYQAGIDEALAQDISREVENIYRRITGIFEYQPPNKTLIEILPDEQSFAVRMTGMPDIWTVAACSGDVIALAPPRGGAHQAGPFDWARVIEHEFVHTVTLNMTRYRIPHWFTEACAVWLEPGERHFDDCLLLAWAVNREKLFALGQLDLAFVRPKEPTDRPLAYAQSSWMLQYLVEQHGYGVVVQMLQLFRSGASTQSALTQAVGIEPSDFMNQFTAWARRQVGDWGLGPGPADPQVAAFLKKGEAAETLDEASVEEFSRLLSRHPDHPELLKISAHVAVTHLDADQAAAAVMRYASSRPVDPWPYERLVEIQMRAGRPDRAVAAMEQLDRWDVASGQWAYQLAQIHQSAGRFDAACEAIERALHRQPYRAQSRELAATVYLQAHQPQLALHHVQALVAIEPDRPVHWVRLGAIYKKLGQHEQATRAIRKALSLDPDTAVPSWFDTHLEKF